MKARRLGPTAAPPARTTGAARPSAARARCADGGRALLLEALPPEVVGHILAFLPPRDIARASRASRLFRGAPGGRSPVEHALRERARARGHARALPTTLPVGVRSWREELFAREHVYELACVHASPVAAGGYFSAFVDAEGGLHTCGEHLTDPRLGHDLSNAPVVCGHVGAPLLRVPTRIASLSTVRVVAVAAGESHLLALSDAGTVYGCGLNWKGELGLGDTEERRSFVLVAEPHGAPLVCVAAGAAHSLALTAAGCAYSWGWNNRGQLGHGDTEDRWEPTRIEALDGVLVGGVAAGGIHTLLLSAHGAVYSCGYTYYGQLGHGGCREQHTPRRIKALTGVCAVHVSAGAHHSLVVGREGAVYSFGSGYGGQLGLGRDVRFDERTPRRIDALAGERIVHACAGHSSSAVVDADGGVRTFGQIRRGPIGHSTGHGYAGMYACHSPRCVHALPRGRVVRVSLSSSSAFFVTADGCVFACGWQTAALGLGVSRADKLDDLTRPTRMEQLPRVVVWEAGSA